MGPYRRFNDWRERRSLTKLDSALALAKRGFRVFPLAENSKKPALKDVDWKTLATCDPARVRELWGDRDYNIGLWTIDMLVLDFDTDRDGLKDLADFEARGVDCSTAVRTASGGMHVYLRTPQGVAVANSVGKIAPGTDVRGTGGYVVAVGSAINGKAYEWI